MNKIIAIDLTFLNDEKHNSNIFLLTVPMGTEIDFVNNEIITMHAILDNREDDVLDESFGRCETCSHYGNCNYCSDCDEGSEYEYYRETVYGKNGRTPESLVSYVCKNNGWNYDILNCDAKINLY